MCSGRFPSARPRTKARNGRSARKRERLRVLYYIAEAFRGLRANSLVNLLALGTITMIMLIMGLFLLVFFNLQASVRVMGERLEVSVYLKDGLTGHEKDFLESRLKAEPGVRKVTYLSKEQALDVFKKELQGQEALLEGLDKNPLPDSFEVNVDRTYAVDGRLEALSAKFSGYAGVEDVSYGRHGAEILGGLLKSSRTAARQSRCCSACRWCSSSRTPFAWRSTRAGRRSS
jgi:cell division transport system permease protein